MYAVERLSSYITRGVYTVSGPFHPFGGAVDIIVVQQQDGSFKSSTWNVRFGKFQGVLKTKEKIVTVCVNGADAQFHMYLDHKGEAYFLRDAGGGDDVEASMSPPSSGDEADGQVQNRRLMEAAQRCDYDESCGRAGAVGGQFDVGENGKLVARTNSRRPRIFGFVFGRRTMKEGRDGGDMERVSSLERAEIAADLLEVKWSTNLPTNDQMGNNSLKVASDGDRVESAVDGKARQAAMRSPDGGVVRDDKVASHHEEISDTICSSLVTAEHTDEPRCNGYPELRTFEEVIEIYSSETCELAQENERLSSSLKAVEFDMSLKESVVVNPAIDLYSHNFHEFSSDRDCHLAAGVSAEGNGDMGVPSFFYCETSESSSARHDVSAGAALEVLNSSSEGEQAQINTEHLNDRGQLPSEENHRFESGPPTVKENFDEYCNENQELNSHMDFMQNDHATAGACEKPVATSAGDLSTESPPSHGLSLQTSQPIETEIEDVMQQHILEKETSQENVTDTNMLEISKSMCVMDGGSSELGYRTMGFNVDQQLASSDLRKSLSSCVTGGTLNTSDEVHELHSPMERMKLDKRDFLVEDINIHEFSSNLHMSGVANGAISLLDNLEEDHLLFNEIDNCVSNDHPAQSVTAAEIEAEDGPSIAPEGGLGNHDSADTSHDVRYADMSSKSKVQTSPIPIPKLKRTSEEKEQWVGSLPNIRSHIHDLERPDVQPTSHSLHIKSITSVWPTHGKDISSFPNIKPSPESKSSQPQLMSENATVVKDDMQRRGEENDRPISPTVEISLCRHLLFEGMGAAAASKVFDAEKVDLEKFTALGPSLVENGKLVIRIGSRYFPWNAAAPIILGIASFGREGIFHPEGMIAVDQTDKSPEEDPSRAIVPSGGSWRLWPFNFKKSRSINPTHLAPDANRTTEKGTEIVSVDNKTISDNNVQKSRVMKKKVRSVTPTSEQLASLNLKEGQNLVTFSFSTAMLGRQQVDARIYLWKWNTRIVVSDVDGTITKSDVLGQFMPLVGKDWSQTGVAHLFSAIKDNGYQLLFLSARAISQAYLTRQFLFNLKQDGKVLPDGPVVISPDGLFPSLYREVIRRAPHEFKISCLEEIQALFPPESNPFYAGFGNRDTDEISYLKVGIPKGKIFIINPRGEVAVNRRVDTKSYTSLHALVNAMFPAVPSAEQEDFNSWNYWKLPLPDIDI